MRSARIIGALACAAALTSAAPAAAADDVETILPSDVPSRFAPQDLRPNSSYSFQFGPATPPIGEGSVTLYTGDGTAKVNLFTGEQSGTALSAIDALAYSTFRDPAAPGAGSQVAALNIPTDIDGDGDWDTTLVFEPVYNTNQGAVASGTWQSWDAYAGGNAVWWSSNPIPSAPNRDTFVSWSTIVAANPNAELLGYGINQGSGNPNLRTSVDALEIGTSGNDDTVYDFEPAISPGSKDDCKKDGWKRFNTPAFKNQGDCVSSFAPGKSK